MMRVSPAQLAKMHERVALKERQRIAEEIAGRSVVERTCGNDAVSDVLDEIVHGLLKDVPAQPIAETMPERRDYARGEVVAIETAQRARNVAMAGEVEAVPIGPNAGAPKRVPLTAEQIANEAQRLLVPGMEREKFPGWDAAVDDGLAPTRERSDDEDIRRLVR